MICPNIRNNGTYCGIFQNSAIHPSKMSSNPSDVPYPEIHLILAIPLSMIHLSKTSPNSCSSFCPNLAGFIPDMFAVPVVFHKKNVGLQTS